MNIRNPDIFKRNHLNCYPEAIPFTKMHYAFIDTLQAYREVGGIDLIFASAPCNLYNPPGTNERIPYEVKTRYVMDYKEGTISEEELGNATALQLIEHIKQVGAKMVAPYMLMTMRAYCPQVGAINGLKIRYGML